MWLCFSLRRLGFFYALILSELLCVWIKIDIITKSDAQYNVSENYPVMFMRTISGTAWIEYYTDCCWRIRTREAPTIIFQSYKLRQFNYTGLNVWVLHLNIRWSAWFNYIIEKFSEDNNMNCKWPQWCPT